MTIPSLLCPLFRLQLVLMLHINIRSSLCFFFISVVVIFAIFTMIWMWPFFFTFRLSSHFRFRKRDIKSLTNYPPMIDWFIAKVQINYYLCVDIWIITNFLFHWSKTFNNIALYSKFFPAFSILNSNWNTKILAARCHQCKPCGVYLTARKI